MKKPVYWMGSTINDLDDFGRPITDTFYDGKTITGQWAIMSPLSWQIHGMAKIGVGLGQRYKKQKDGRWLKVGG